MQTVRVIRASQKIVLMSCCPSQLLAACERDGEADRALEAFARMEREAPGDITALSCCTHSF